MTIPAWCRRLAFAALLAAQSACGWAQAAAGTATAPVPAPWRVAIILGLDPSTPAAVLQDRALRSALLAAAPNGVEFFSDALDAMRFRGADLTPEFLALLSRKYERQKIDLVIASTEFGLDFVEKHHARLWPGAAVMATGITEQRLRERAPPADFATLPIVFDYAGTIGIVERLQPKARRLIVIGGEGIFDREVSARALEAARASRQGWVVEDWHGVPLDELRARLAALDGSAAVFLGSMYRDRNGRSSIPAELIKPLSTASGAPMYAVYQTYVGHGVTAGSMTDFEANGRRMGELAAQILSGAVAAAGATLPAAAPRCMADAQRLAGFGLAATALPPGCEVVGAPPSLWREYRNTVLITGLVLLLQAATIVALVLQRRRRRAAEAEVMERRIELNRATRFAAMGELSASIAHEIGQPLGAILSNAEAAEMMLDSGRADESQLRAILADIRRDDLRAHEVIRRLRALLQKQQPEHAPLDLHETLVDALELIEPEARRRGMRIERSLTATNAHLVGDHIQMQQVLLNLALNAMDAMADTAPPQRSLKVATTDRDGGIELSVADQGHGVADEHRGRLFDSFFTTKPRGMGMGLSIVRTIVEAHDGRIQAEPGSGGGGTVFRVWLPRRVATEPVPLAQPQSAFRQVPA